MLFAVIGGPWCLIAALVAGTHVEAGNCDRLWVVSLWLNAIPAAIAALVGVAVACFTA